MIRRILRQWWQAVREWCERHIVAPDPHESPAPIPLDFAGQCAEAIIRALATPHREYGPIEPVWVNNPTAAAELLTCGIYGVMDAMRSEAHERLARAVASPN
jgi:hypothetical protein